MTDAEKALDRLCLNYGCNFSDDVDVIRAAILRAAEVRERDKAATNNYNLMREHLTKTITDRENEILSLSRGLEAINDKAQGLAKAAQEYIDETCRTGIKVPVLQHNNLDNALAAFKADEMGVES